MMMGSKRFAAFAIAACAMTLTGCTRGPKDIRVVSVTDVDFKDETQLDWFYLKTRPSIPISRVDFSTSKDLLGLARKYGYNVSFMIGLCSKDGVKETIGRYGGVYWGKAYINYWVKDEDLPGYAEAVAKGPPFTYQVYVERLPPNPPGPMCFTLTGGAMFDGLLRSNAAVIPIGARKQ